MAEYLPITIIARSAPGQGDRAFAGLDVMLAFSAFEHQVCCIFYQDGVYQLLPGQDTDAVYGKTLTKRLGGLKLFGIQQVHVHQPSLQQRAIAMKDLVLPATPIDDVGIKAQLARSGQVFVL